MPSSLSISYFERRRQKRRSEAIDRWLEEDTERVRRERAREIRVVVLGAKCSGKTTFVDWMQIQLGAFPAADRLFYRPIVRQNVVDITRSVIDRIHGAGNDFIFNKALVERIEAFSSGASTENLSLDFAGAVDQLWQEPLFQVFFERHRYNLYLGDSAEYFFENVLRIGSPDYVPTEADVLHAYKDWATIRTVQLRLGGLSAYVLDVSSEIPGRKKWEYYFGSVVSVIFCAALSDYNINVEDLNQQTGMNEALKLFEAVVNSRWLTSSSVILLMTKLDVFKAKLSKIPLEDFYEDYTGGSDVDKACRYVLHMFMQTNRGRLSVHPHFTQPMDTTSACIGFASVKETILQNALKSSDVL